MLAKCGRWICHTHSPYIAFSNNQFCFRIYNTIYTTRALWVVEMCHVFILLISASRMRNCTLELIIYCLAVYNREYIRWPHHTNHMKRFSKRALKNIIFKLLYISMKYFKKKQRGSAQKYRYMYCYMSVYVMYNSCMEKKGLW